jgi:hypothetical protein
MEDCTVDDDLLITVIRRFKACPVFDRSSTGIMGSKEDRRSA